MREILIVACGGAVGAVARYALSGWTYDLLGSRFPWGTLVVNVTGCFLLGAIMQAGLATDLISRGARLALAVGFLGSFTTFSTFGYETLTAMAERDLLSAGANVIGSVVLGLGAVFLGVVAARGLLGGA